MSGQKRGACRFFSSSRGCRHGSSCRFSHDLSKADSQPATPRPKAEPSAQQSKRRSWSYMLRSHDSLSPHQVSAITSSALEIIESGDSDVKQSLIKELGEENGLRWIRGILEASFDHTESSSVYHYGYGQQNLSFHRHCVPFLQLVSHAEVLSSLVLEKAVGTIYNIIYGPSGQRAIRFFEKVAENIRSLAMAGRDGTDPEAGDKLQQAIVPALAALLSTISLNQEAIVKPEFGEIVLTIRGCVDESGTRIDRYTTTCANRNIQKINERLHRGDSIPHIGTGYIPVDPFPDFELSVDLPGELSAHGPRHNNDHANIEKIEILPTTDELKSTRNEFLPVRNASSNHHEEGIYRLLDSQFRLLREDTTGQLRDAVCMLVQLWEVIVEGNNQALKKRSLSKINAKMSIFEGIAVERLRFDRRKGILVDVSFNQPQRLAGTDRKERHQWWSNESRDLNMGSLVALVDDSLETTFMLVADRPVEKRRFLDPDSDEAQPTGGIHDLSSDPYRGMTTLQFVDVASTADQARIARLAQSSAGAPGNAVLVEFPGLLFASFEPILKCLQSLHANPNVPFIRWIAPSAQETYDVKGDFVDIPPPLYLTRRNVTLDLTCITHDGEPLSHSVQNPVTVEQLTEHTSLDRGQSESLILSLQSELALVQGPPGTGKSYLGLQLAKVLLANRRRIDIGPIICVCYTNHALDQFLEHVIGSGESNVIRLGSRSKSERMQTRTLAVVQQGTQKTKVESSNIWSSMQQLESLESRVEEILLAVSEPPDANDVAEYLQTASTKWYESLFSDAVDSEHYFMRRFTQDGFQEVRRKNKWTKASLYGEWVKGRPGPSMNHRSWRQAQTDRQLPQLLDDMQSEDLWALELRERLRLKLFWEQQIKSRWLCDLQTLTEEFTKLQHFLGAQYKEVSKRCLEQARVIGVTTTGLAQNSELLRSLQAKVLLIEEAAEVLEAHTVTAFLPSVEHTILIGDHLQLRPQISKYELSMESEQGKKYALDESLFERLARQTFGGARIPIAQLDVQRRMHPSIASLVRNTLYPSLKDHKDTSTHSEVVGMRRRLFWLNHQKREDAASSDHLQTSKTNEWEAEMVVSLVRHLSRQGVYKRDDVAVITPYLGQLRKLRRKFSSICDLVIAEKDAAEMELQGDDSEEELKAEAQVSMQKGRMIEGLRLATVDNFQGEEAKVIIISLVRSNPELKCGFLKTSNRINVLLSRARDGMYILGDVETCSRVKMWTDVTRMLEHDGNLGTRLELKCLRHPEKQIFVSSPEDFVERAPEGGCQEQCGKRLGCGHSCVMKCHSDALHKIVQCYQDCTRTFKNCNHVCPKRCWEDCGLCRVKLTTNITLPCGHAPSSLECHQTTNLAAIKCQEQVVRVLPRCGHTAKVRCYTDMESYRCRESCGAPLPCGHSCGRRCADCTVDDPIQPGEFITNHKTCVVVCGRSFSTCNHSCRQRCHPDEACKPCDLPCEVRCAHSRCNKLCHEPCPPCAETCTWACPHRGQCTMPCAVPCDVIPCNRRCEKELACGHQCPSVCGESCPGAEYCQICAGPEVKSRPVDLITFAQYEEVDLDDEPVIFPACGHFYTLETLDGLMDMSAFYYTNPLTGEILGPRPIENTTMKNCPDCRFPLRDIHRYNRVVKTALLDESTKRFMAHAMNMFTKLQDDIIGWETSFETQAREFVERTEGGAMASKTAALEKYKRDVRAVTSQINRFLKDVDQDEQPYGRVQMMVTTTHRRQETVDNFEFGNGVIQHGNSLRGNSLKLRTLWAILWNYKTMLKALDTKHFNTEWRKFVTPEIKKAQKVCTQLRDASVEKMYRREEIEARIYHAQLVALENSTQQTEAMDQDAGEARRAALKAETESLEYCERILTPSTRFLEEDIKKAKILVNGGTFYSFVSSEEKRQIYAAMAAGFRGTGHWYYCENRHPFTVGECGAPMELARCPECGAGVGGQHHTPAAGVQHATDLEQEFGRLGIN